MSGTIKELGDLITENLNNNVPLKNQSNIILEYYGEDWQKSKSFCKEHYKRNLVYRNDLIKILIICWDANQKSKIHDHPNGGCLVRLLEGELYEKVYKKNGNNFEVQEKNKLSFDKCSYQEGSNGLHKVVNKSNKGSITLHVYSPPSYTPKFY